MIRPANLDDFDKAIICDLCGIIFSGVIKCPICGEYYVGTKLAEDSK